MLLHEAADAGVQLKPGFGVENLSKGKTHFRITAGGEEFEAPALVVATGGLSFPKLGATDFGYKIAKQFGLKLTARSPALDGFVLAEAERRSFEGLSGLSCEANLILGKRSFSESLLFTHLGLSGPAALQASLYWEPGLEIEARLSQPLPRRLQQRFRVLNLDPMAWRFVPERTVGYAKAEVTRGGVDTGELSSKTMESQKVPGLYFIGEVVDVTGQLGGYNFQWAWASGFAAGNAL
jgi:predicted flavoprotein YhiN